MLPGRPDFVFAAERVAIFVDGCFWHKCPHHCRVPQNNVDYWVPKLDRNVRRDRRVRRLLRVSGWTVLRFWEHDLEHDRRVAARVLKALSRGATAAR